APGEVPAGLGEAMGKSRLDRIALQIECHDGDRGGGISRGTDAGGPAHEDEVDLSPDGLGSELREDTGLPTGGAELKRDALTLNPAEVAQALAHGIDGRRSRTYAGVQNSHDRRLP